MKETGMNLILNYLFKAPGNTVLAPKIIFCLLKVYFECDILLGILL